MVPDASRGDFSARCCIASPGIGLDVHAMLAVHSVDLTLRGALTGAAPWIQWLWHVMKNHMAGDEESNMGICVHICILICRHILYYILYI